MRKCNQTLKSITKDITSWADQVYPDRTIDGTIRKLKEELRELEENPMDAWELADVLILIFDLCDQLGFDPAKLVHNKMNVNKARKWEIKDGVLKHVKDN